MSCIIKTAEEENVQEVYRFICQLEETDFDFTLFASIYTKNIRNPNYIYLVAVAATGDIAGFISCHTQNLLHHCGSVGEIQELFVSEAFRGKGIGYRLVEEAEKKAALQGCLIIEVTAQNKRLETHRFYENIGFGFTHKKFVKQLTQPVI